MEPSPQYQHLHLPRGEVVVYSPARPNTRVLARDIRSLGYDVWEHHVETPGFQHSPLPRGAVLNAIVLGGAIILFASREEGSSSSGSSSEQGSEASCESYIDSDNGHWGRLTHRNIVGNSDRASPKDDHLGHQTKTKQKDAK